MNTIKELPLPASPGDLVRAAADGMFWSTLLGIAGVVAGFAGRWRGGIGAEFDWPLAGAIWGVAVVTAIPVMLAIWVANRQITIIDNLTERHGGPDSVTVRLPDQQQPQQKTVGLWDKIKL